ncbi:MAG: metallopeptidase family protein [Kiritimatiellae bacterium]|nr:metallopeptidase family protein [Kiritimatiellia bacterium]
MSRRLDPVVRRRLRAAAAEEVRRVLEALPAPLRHRARAIPVVIEDRPSTELIREGHDPDLLGLFVGRGHADDADDPLPAEVLLFVENLWAEAEGDAAAFRMEVRRTLLHELGHYLGLDEDALAERDLD